MRRHRKRQAEIHAARVVLDRRVDEALHLGKSHDLVEFGVDFGALHPKNRPIEIDVLPAGQLGMKAGADLQQGAHSPGDVRFARAGLGHPCQNFEQGALPGAVLADDPQHPSLAHVEGHITQGPDHVLAIVLGATAKAAKAAGECITQRPIAGRPAADAVLLTQISNADRVVAHTMSAKVRSMRRK